MSDVIIDSVADYVKHTTELLSKIGNHSDKLFFRGQADIDWDILPSIFRDERYLRNEAFMIHEACRIVANELNFDNDFELLTKLQHNGMPTRLLDVSLNPLVALFFACESQPSKNGVIHFAKVTPFRHDSFEIIEASKLAKVDFENGIHRLGIRLFWVSPYFNDAETSFTENEYDKMTKRLNKNYFVLPKHSNERLIRQSGAFLLCLSFIGKKNNDVLGSSIVKKNAASLKSEFDETKFVIPFDKKEKIKRELNFYNINKASLYPELEHKMQYLKSTIG